MKKTKLINELTLSKFLDNNDKNDIDAAEREVSVDNNDTDLDDVVPQSGNPDRQGVIRVIANAHLVYKRENAEGTYDELWIYNVGNKIHDELETRRNILAGTDIPLHKTQSPEGDQSYSATTMGNAQLLKIEGLQQ